MSTYRERVLPSPSWWAGGVAFGVTCGWLVLVAATPALGLATGIVAAALAAVGLWTYAPVVEVGPDGFRAGRARLPSPFVGDARVLSGTSLASVLGPQADARAWLLVRPYVSSAVQVKLEDPDDPAPYWVVSTRRPDELVAALSRLTPTSDGSDPDQQHDRPGPSRS